MSTTLEDIRQYLPLHEVDLVLYHGGCCDGFGGAFGIWSSSMNDELEVYGCNYAAKEEELSKIIEMCKNKNIIMIDFTFKASTLKKIDAVASRFAILDHHVTALNEINEAGLAKRSVLDMEHSGCWLGWYYAHHDGDPPMPEFMEYIQDRDLWKWELENTEAFTASFFGTVEFDLDEWLKLHDEDLVKQHISDGKVIVKHNSLEINNLANHAIDLQWNGYNIKVINSTSHISKLGNQLAKECDFALLWLYDSKRRCIKVSLRSDSEGNNVNVSNIAKDFGGGGHPNAAGFTWRKTIDELLYPVSESSSSSSSSSSSEDSSEQDIILKINQPLLDEEAPLLNEQSTQKRLCLRKPKPQDWLFGTSILIVGVVIGFVAGMYIPIK